MPHPSRKQKLAKNHDNSNSEFEDENDCSQEGKNIFSFCFRLQIYYSFAFIEYLNPISKKKSTNNENILENESRIMSSCHSNTVLNFTPPPNPPPPPPLALSAPHIPPATAAAAAAVTQQPRLTSPLSTIQPPPPSLKSLLSIAAQTKEEIKIKVESDRLLNHLTKQGFDRTKSACALAITNNNLDSAIEILTKYTNKLSTLN